MGSDIRNGILGELPPLTLNPPTSDSRSNSPTISAPNVGPVYPNGIPFLTVSQLRAMYPNARASDLASYQLPLALAMAQHGIADPFQQAAFLGQIGAESNQLGRGREDLTYKTPQRLQAVYGPKVFPTADSAKPYVRNPTALAEKVYGNKNGNVPGTGDGWTYRGGGPLQITGRKNYRAVGYENTPDALSDPYQGSDASGAYWQQKHLNDMSNTQLDRAQFDRVTRRINSKGDAADPRWQFYLKALGAL